MKRFLTALAISAFLIVGAGVYAVDFQWTGGTAVWELPTNWNNPGAGFPGGGALARVIDRAIIANAANNPVLFSAASGSGNFNSRMIQELRLDATPAAAAVSLTVSGDRLQLRYTELISASGKTATLTITGGSFKTDDLVADASATGAAAVIFDIDADTRVAAQTIMAGDVDITVADEKVFDVGLLIIKQGSTVTKTDGGTDGGVLQTS